MAAYLIADVDVVLVSSDLSGRHFRASYHPPSPVHRVDVVWRQLNCFRKVSLPTTEGKRVVARAGQSHVRPQPVRGEPVEP